MVRVISNGTNPDSANAAFNKGCIVGITARKWNMKNFIVCATTRTKGSISQYYPSVMWRSAESEEALLKLLYSEGDFDFLITPTIKEDTRQLTLP